MQILRATLPAPARSNPLPGLACPARPSPQDRQRRIAGGILVRSPSSGVALCASPATASRQATPASTRAAVSLTSAVDRIHVRTARRHRRRPTPSGRAVPPARPPRSPRECARQAAADRRSPPDRARPAARSRPARRCAPRCPAHRPRAASSRPIAPSGPVICRLPRAVTSTMPLPCRERRFAEPDQASWAKVLPATGLSRTSRPSPVCIGAASAGQAPRRERRVHAAIS